MDPVSQGVLGGAAVQALVRKASRNRALVVAGILSAMAPDLDIIFHSSTDPLYGLMMHRHFTHSLWFAPLGGLICAGIFHFLFRYALKWKGVPFKLLLISCVVGYFTHGPLDLCTSYGTLLFWPTSSARYSIDIVSIIDPLYTVPLLIGVAWSLWKRRSRYATLALLYSCLYLFFGAQQRNEALEVQRQLAAHRGHEIVRSRVMPTFLNNFLWRSIYESKGRYYADAIRVLPTSEPLIWTGVSVEKYEWPEEVSEESVLGNDLKRWGWFADQWLYPTGGGQGRQVIGDFRYSIRPQSAESPWGISFDVTKPSDHIERIRPDFGRLARRDEFFSMLKGDFPGAQTLTELKR